MSVNIYLNYYLKFDFKDIQEPLRFATVELKSADKVSDIATEKQQTGEFTITSDVGFVDKCEIRE